MHYTLYRALRSVFQWVAAHVPLAVQHVPDMPFADAAWPDVRDTAHMAAAVEAALTDPTQLGEVGTGVQVATGGRLTPKAFASLVPRIAAALSELHRDLPAIWDLAKQMYDSRWAPGDMDPTGTAGATANDGDGDGGSSNADVAKPAVQQLEHQRKEQQHASRSNRRTIHRRMQQETAIPPNYKYAMPPDFNPQPPAGRPPLLIPLVVHVMSYKEAGGRRSYGPAGLSESPARFDQLVRVANAALKPTNIQVFVQVSAGRVAYVRAHHRGEPTHRLLRTRRKGVSARGCRSSAWAAPVELAISTLTSAYHISHMRTPRT